MSIDIEKRIVKARNELRSQKVAQELVYSQLLMPENAPTIAGSGAIDYGSLERYDVMARWRVRFTRTDGIKETPFVNFAYDFNFHPSYAEFQSQSGVSVEGNDLNYPEEPLHSGYESAAGDDYVDFNIDVNTETAMTYSPFPNLSVDFSVQAISSVPGKLSLERLI